MQANAVKGETTAKLKAPSPASVTAPTPPSGITSYTVEFDRLSQRAKLTLVWPSATKASYFSYRNYAYVLFNAKAPINLNQFSYKYFKTVQIIPHPQATILKIEMVKPYDLLVNHVKDDWIFLAGEMKHEGATYPYSLDFQYHPQGNERILVLDEPATIIDFQDPETQDRFVTLLNYNRGMIRSFTTPLFHIIPSFMGLTFIPSSANFSYSFEAEKLQLKIYGPDDLKFSSTLANITSERIPSPVSPLLDLESYDLALQQQFHTFQSLRLNTAKAASKTQLQHDQIELAKFYLANGYYHEAIGVLRLMRAQDEKVFNQHPELYLMLDVSNILAHSIDIDELTATSPFYQEEPEAKLVTALLNFSFGRHKTALENFIKALPFIQKLPRHIRNTIALKAFEAAVYNQFQQPIFQNLIDARYLSACDQAVYKFFDARYKQITVPKFDAPAVYKELVYNPNYRVRLLARLALLNTSSPPDKAKLSDLESLRFFWRGDALELSYLSTLAELYTKAGHVPRALECYRTINNFLWHLESSQVYIKAAQDLFYNTFKQHNTKPALEQLGFYFNFIDLVPHDRRHVVVMNHVVRLYDEIGLISDALATLTNLQDKLTRQYRNQTLPHEKYIKIKNQLLKNTAIIYLRTNAVKHALRTLEQIDLTVPDINSSQEFNTSVRFMKAIALGEAGKFDQALTIIQDMDNRKAHRLRTIIYMAQKRWADALKLLESVITEAKITTFKDVADLDLLFDLAMVANQLQDWAYLKKLKETYSAKIADPQKKQVFEILTNDVTTVKTSKTALLSEIQQANKYIDLMQGITNDVLKTPWETPFDDIKDSLSIKLAPEFLPVTAGKPITTRP
jgi:hypothetical protein